jgi:GSH-dependent disulfide-bond oxidoreductase
MIDLYTFGTGNGWRASIALEECGLPYRAHKVDLTTGEQRASSFLEINPLGKIPVIVDPEGPRGERVTINESGAILLYCAEKAGKFIPLDPVRRLAALRWVFHAVSDASEPIAAHFRLSRLPQKPDAALAYYYDRLSGILKYVDAHLADREYLIGDVSIADLAFYPVALQGKALVGVDALRHLQRWLDAVSARPAVMRGMAVPG